MTIDNIKELKMFLTSSDKFNLVLVAFIYHVTPVVLQDTSILTVPLNKTITYNDREMYSSYIQLNHSSTVEVRFTNIDTRLYFILLQVHSQFDNITLSSNSTEISEVIGTNLGLISILETLPNNVLKADTFFIQNPNKNITMSVYIAVHGYMRGDPIPGGCNSEWKPKIVPYLKTKLTSATITVEAAAPSIDADCLFVKGAIATFYMMYISEMNFDTELYYEGIRKMMSLKNIEKYGEKITLMSAAWAMRRMLSAYPGTAVVFVAVARNINNSTQYSVYVPTVSYSCPEVDGEGCKSSVNVVFDLLCAVVLFVGMFVSFMGHRFFKTAMFLAGFFGGFILTYFLVNVMDINMGAPALVAAAGLSGIFFGAIWLLFWWLYGIPVIAVFLPALNVGFIFACIVYYRLPATVKYMNEDFNFWTVFIIIMVLTALTMAFVTYAASIVSSSFLGGFCVMFAFDYYIGANMKYIIINTLRRAVVPNFNLAVLAPPFLSTDLLLTLMWIFVALSGWAFQHWHNRGRPPFPPPPRSTREAAPSDRAGPTVRMYGAVTDLTRRLFPIRTTFRGTSDTPSAPRMFPRPIIRVTPEVPAEPPSSLDERAPLLFTAET